MHKELVHSGRISQSLGAVYDDLVSSSRKADYDPSAHISPDDALEAMRRAAEFVAAMKRLTAQ